VVLHPTQHIFSKHIHRQSQTLAVTQKSQQQIKQEI